MIKLRYALKKDMPEIVQLLEQLGYTSDVNHMHERLLRIKERNGEVIVAINESQEVIGCIHVLLDLRFAEGERGEVVSLVVRNDVRRQGVGKKLLNEAQQWILNKGCHTVRVRANVVREEAHIFYKDQGFQEIKSQKVFQKKMY